MEEFLAAGSGRKLTAKRVWFITGHFLGETGMSWNGHGKETFFHGTDESAADAIAQTGFDDNFSASGKFGPGLYFSPEAMTSYAYGHTLFLCEVALRSELKKK